ncbi:snurportin-1 [Elysia marginata]|uniref:Snurportin-1 n=1 Tax=Elysia marginata TaxID=1093978 RepID=A0AAV4HIP1_9GAST|nr:snurportin-1 [Elysia marginata]
MSYQRGYDDYGYGGGYGGYDDRRGYGGGGGGGWGDRDGYRGGGGWDDGYRGGWDRDRDRGNFGGGDRRDRDRAFGGRGGGGGGGGFNKRGGGGRGGPGGNRGQKRPSSGNSGPPKRVRDDNNWAMGDRHPAMQSIFMESKPEDFEESWMFAVCPSGKRRIIVAADETTQSYNSTGASDAKFKSCLPNGNEAFNEVHKLQDLTILDTMLNNEEKKCYIIDMMHWRHYPYYDTEADFRFYCLADKYSELKKPTEIHAENEYSLHLLPKLPCSQKSIGEALEQAKNDSVKVEGLLFINKSSLYATKDSSDSQWLRLDKMEEILGFAPPEGLDFQTTSSRDDRKRQEQEERQKLKEQRDAVTKEAQEQSVGDQGEQVEEAAKTEEPEETPNAEAEEAGKDESQDFTAEDYTTAGADEGVWF